MNNCSRGQHVEGKSLHEKMVTMNDGKAPYEHVEDVFGENMQEENVEIESNGRREQITPHNLVETMIILMKC